MIWVLVCNNMCRCEHHFGSIYCNLTILETVSNRPQWAPMCLCQGKMRKSKVKNIFSYHFPRWPVGVKPYHRTTYLCPYHTVLKFPWLRNHLRFINNKNTATSSIRCCDQVFLQSMAFYVKIWTGMVSNNTISWSATYEIPISTVNSNLYRRFMSAPLDDLCPYFCLNPMVVHRKTCILMFCNT